MTIDRREFLSALGAASFAGACTQPPAPKRPNILLIMADDMGFSDIGPYGGEIRTPTLDRLAANGLRFRQFYNAARCCPTRASLLTGLYQHQAGVGYMVDDRGHPSYQGYLNERCATIAEALKPAGYVTLISGKWHVGEEPEHWPARRGFDRSFGLISGASNYFKLDGARQMNLDGEPYTPPEDGSFYMTDALGDNAARMLRESAGGEDPFFLYLPFTAPHWPLHAKPEDIASYAGAYAAGWDELRRTRYERMVEMGVIDAEWELSPRDEGSFAWSDLEEGSDEKALWERRMEVYAAMITSMDENIGKVVAHLEEAGKLDDTLILFLTDNGGCHEDADIEQGTPRNTWGDPDAMPGPADSFDGYEKPWANASNTPFRRFKSWVHEGGISSPLVCHWPNGLKTAPGSFTNSVAHIIDVMPTCLDLAGAEYPAGRTALEGETLRAVFETGERPGEKTVFWEHRGNRAVRDGDWKLTAVNGGPWELYDLATDRSELNDLAAEEPDRVQALANAYATWAERAGVVPWEELTG